MKFLKVLGTILSRGLGIFLGIEPLLTPFIGSANGTPAKVINDLTSVGQIVVQAEALIQGEGLGATKLAAATPLVANVVRTSELVSGRKIENEAEFIAACQKITSGVADVINSLHHDLKVPVPVQ
jgi:hypothetical protein